MTKKNEIYNTLRSIFRGQAKQHYEKGGKFGTFLQSVHFTLIPPSTSTDTSASKRLTVLVVTKTRNSVTGNDVTA